MAFANGVMKYLSQIAAVDAATGSYIFDRDVIRKILFYEVYCFFYIVIAHFTGFIIRVEEVERMSASRKGRNDRSGEKAVHLGDWQYRAFRSS